MGHTLRLFAGPKAALRPYREAIASLRIFALTPAAPLFVLPLSDDLLDGLHRRYGTGEWLEHPAHPIAAPPRLTSTDLTFAAHASTGSALAYLETEYFGGVGQQAAAVWIDGRLAMRPALAHSSEGRPPKLLPINGALRMLGVTARYATPDDDEFTAFGLSHYRDHDAIAAKGLAVGW
jgi:hypothetical protein